MTYEQIYKAALSAVREVGPDIKKMSWFGRNSKVLDPSEFGDWKIVDGPAW